MRAKLLPFVQTFEIRKLIVKTTMGYCFIPFNRLEYIQEREFGCRFFLTNDDYIDTDKSFQYFCSFMGAHGFYLVHQSYLINIQMIKDYSVRHAYFVTHGGNIVPTSDREIEALWEQLETGELSMA